MSAHTLHNWTAMASKASPHGQAFIAGDFVDSASKEEFLTMVLERAAIRPGDPLDPASRMGVMATVSVNTFDAMSNQTPFGGIKQSGFGRDLSLHALNQYTAPKTTWISY